LMMVTVPSRFFCYANIRHWMDKSCEKNL
jgi:hypothetical protein